MDVSFTSKTREALQKPLYQRCEEIEKLIEDSSIQNLHGFFSQLLSSIFGYSGGIDWGLKTLSRHSREFAILRRFLSPQGAVFKLIDKLQADDLHRYEFYISCLPFPTQSSLSEGFIPVLYHNKVPIRTPGETVNVVLLNAFEYYMFHYTYYIVHQQSYRESNLSTPEDHLYLFVVEDYLNFFLPADGSPLVSSHAKTSSPVTSLWKPPSWHEHSPYGRSQYYQHQFKGLIKPSSGGSNLPTVHHGMFDHGSQETWRSETFLQILVEFWLNQNTMESVTSNVLSHGKEYFMPSSDHVRVVRMLVKHVHSFVYAKGPDVHQLPILHPSDELRRNIIPQFLQKKLYYFFNHCFSHWPLDPSFKFVLETWLSFIQPWRYSKSTSQGGGSGGDESRETASPQWKSFVFDNLLFYSALLLEFVSRACRFNLCSAKDAHLLFRVVKVFAQQNLVDMVEEGENILLVPSRDHWHGPQGSMAPSSSALRAHIVDLEGPSYVYEPVFCKPGAAKVDELQSRVLAALSETTSKSQPSQQSSVNTNGFIGWIKDVFGSSGLQENGFDRKAEEGKLVTYLEQASTLLSSIVRGCDNFDGVLNRTIPWENSSPVTGHRHVSLPGAQATLPDHVETDTGVVPTPLGRYQMMNGLRKFEVRYTGDPELQPIRSFENPTLVRLLYKLSTHLNEKCGKSLQNFYTNSRVFRSIVCFTSPAFRSPASSPTPPRYSSTSSSHSPQTTLITPRISLRFLASYKTLLYLFIFWLLCQVVSMNRFLVLLLWICVLLVMLLYHFVPGFEKSYKAVSSRKES